MNPQTRIQSDHSLITSKAEELTNGLTSDYEKAVAIYRFVNSSMEYVTDSAYANKGALAAIQTGKGVCEEYATLFAALCRASDIPTRLITGYKMDKSTGEIILSNHVWCEIYLEGFEWVPVEPTIVTNSIDSTISQYFGKIDGDEYVAFGVYNADKASRVLQGITEEYYEEKIERFENDTVKKTNRFADIGNYGWAKDGIDSLFQKEIVEGYSTREYGPERNISRIEFICMLSRTLKYMDIAIENSETPYYSSDFPNGHWAFDEYSDLMYYYQAITPSVGKGAGADNILKVFGSTIDVNRPITRAEVVALIDAFLRPTKSASTSGDIVSSNGGGFTMSRTDGQTGLSDIGGHKFYSSIVKSVSNGLITGYPDGTFKPDGAITRAEMAVVLDRYIDNMIHNI